eukprot:365684-Chlamydomonas_euryale.AAC.11
MNFLHCLLRESLVWDPNKKENSTGADAPGRGITENQCFPSKLRLLSRDEKRMHNCLRQCVHVRACAQGKGVTSCCRQVLESEGAAGWPRACDRGTCGPIRSVLLVRAAGRAAACCAGCVRPGCAHVSQCHAGLPGLFFTWGGLLQELLPENTC